MLWWLRLPRGWRNFALVRRRKKQTLHMTPAGVKETAINTPGRMDGGGT
jgi:hypothetical protein